MQKIKYETWPDTFYSTNLATTTVKNEYMPVWVKKVPDSLPKEVLEVKGDGKVQNLRGRGNIEFDVTARNEVTIVINKIFYPGWSAKANGQEINVIPTGDMGLIGIKVPRGDHQIKIFFTETPIRTISNVFSIVGFSAFLFLIIKKRYVK